MRRVLAVVAFLSLSAALSLSFMLLPAGPSSAASQTSAVFAIPASDGYGVAECLASGDACGAVVAQAWCAAHGFDRAERFGRDLAGTEGLAIACAR